MFSGPFSLGGSVQGSPPGYSPVQGGGASPIEVQNAEAALRQHYPEIGGFTEYGGQGRDPSTSALGFTWNGASNPWWFGQGPMSVESLLNSAPPPSAGATDPPNPPPAPPPGPNPGSSGIAGSPLEFGDRGGDVGVPGAPAGQGAGTTTSPEGNTMSDPASTYGGGRGGYAGGFNLGGLNVGGNLGPNTSHGAVSDAINSALTSAFDVSPAVANAINFGGRTAIGTAVPALGAVNAVLGAIDSITGTMTNQGRAGTMNQATANAVSAHSLGEHDMSPAPNAQMTLDAQNANTNQGPMAEAGITSDQEAVDAANANTADPEVDVTTGTPGIGPPGVDAGIAGQAPGVAGTASGTNAGGNSSGNAPAGSPAAGDPAGTGLADAAAAASGAGVGVGDGTVICTVLHDRGLMTEDLWIADGDFGRALDPSILRGYQRWARPFAGFLRRHDWALRLVAPLALAWANEMAFQRGVPTAHRSWLGRLIMAAGIPVCRWLGRRAPRTVTA